MTALPFSSSSEDNMPEKFGKGGYSDFLTPMDKGPKSKDSGHPSVANVPVVTPPDPLGVVPKGGKGKGKKIGM